MNKIFKKINLSIIVSMALIANHLVYATSQETMAQKATLEAKLSQALDFSGFDIKTQVATAWRLASIQIDEAVSRSGNKLIFDQEQALKLAQFAYDTSNENEQISIDDLGSSTAVLARWYLIFAENSDAAEIVKQLCLEYKKLHLDESHQAYNSVNDMYNWAITQIDN